jgi:small conductance mechanosensitive channel
MRLFKYLFTLAIFFIPALAFAQAQSPVVQAPPELKVDFSSQISTFKKIVDWVAEALVKYSLQVIAGIIILIVGWMVARFVGRFIQNFLLQKNVDVTVTKFLVNGVKLLLMGFAVIVALGKFGIEIAPFIAGLSVVGFGTSFALQGPLSNYAAGATLIFTKPFKVGDIIEVIGMMGEVEDLTMPRTVLRTIDGTRIVIPNRHIIGEVVHNYSNLKKLDINVGVDYATDVEKAVAVVCDLVKSEPRISQTPPPKIGISQFADSAINIYARLWCKQADYWEVMFAVNKAILEAFRKNNINIPFPQRDVHMIEPKR